MTAKWWSFKWQTGILALLFFFFGQGDVQAQERREQRMERYGVFWQNLIPSHLKTQFAGGMGLVSIGTGWDYGKKNQWETDLFFGIVPKYATDKTKVTFTVKQNYMPWRLPLNKHLSVDPLTCGLYVNTIFGENFWRTEPDKYPSGYYSFSTKLRLNAFVGQRLTFHPDNAKWLYGNAITLYYELSSCDLYIASAFTNRYIGVTDIVKLSLGVKIQLL